MALAAKSLEMIADDLAPGDAKAREFDFRGFDVVRICSSDDPLFPIAYERLWDEFGAKGEMEAFDVIEQRLDWQPARRIGDSSLRYEIILVQRNRQFVAVRDHTAIVTQQTGGPIAVVHLSHVLIDPPWRRIGLSGWLRAWPLQTARAALSPAGFAPTSPITLVAEMEHPIGNLPSPAPPIDREGRNARLIRLKAYEKAGFKKVDPRAINYFQPDFRLPAEIDVSGRPKPLPFALIVRRVGREQENTISGREVRRIVESLYTMYDAGFRESDMAIVWRMLENYPAENAEIALLPPTST